MRRFAILATLAAAMSLFSPRGALALVSAGQVVPNFTKTDTDGIPRSLSDYAGKVVFIFVMGWF